jgi:hypothetical protein
MAANPLAAYGMYPDPVSLDEVFNTLNRGGIGNKSICMMLSPKHPIAAAVRAASVLSTDREASAVTARLIGWLAEFGAVVIPTVGCFIRSQEFFQAIFCEKKATARYGSSQTLEDLGFPECDAERFDTRLREVGALVYISCAESTNTEWALELLRGTGAQEFGTLDHHQAAMACYA